MAGRPGAVTIRRIFVDFRQSELQRDRRRSARDSRADAQRLRQPDAGNTPGKRVP